MTTRVLPKIYADHYIENPPFPQGYASLRIEELSKKIGTSDLLLSLDLMIRDGTAILKAAITHGRAVNSGNIPLYEKEVSDDLSTITQNFQNIDKFARKKLRSSPQASVVEERLTKLAALSTTMRAEIERLNKLPVSKELIPIEERGILGTLTSPEMMICAIRSDKEELSPVAARAHEAADKLSKEAPSDKAEFIFSLNIFVQDLMGVEYAVRGQKFPSKEETGASAKNSAGNAIGLRQLYRELFTLVDDIKKVKIVAQAFSEKQGDMSKEELTQSSYQNAYPIASCLKRLNQLDDQLSLFGKQLRDKDFEYQVTR